MESKINWVEKYGPKKFQEGGAMAAPAAPAPAAPAAPAAPEGGDLEAMIAQYAQTRDPQLAVAICDMIVELMAQGGGGAPAGGAPEGAAPAEMAKCGTKMKKKGPVFKIKSKK